MKGLPMLVCVLFGLAHATTIDRSLTNEASLRLEAGGSCGWGGNAKCIPSASACKGQLFPPDKILTKNCLSTEKCCMKLKKTGKKPTTTTTPLAIQREASFGQPQPLRVAPEVKTTGLEVEAQTLTLKRHDGSKWCLDVGSKDNVAVSTGMSQYEPKLPLLLFTVDCTGGSKDTGCLELVLGPHKTAGDGTTTKGDLAAGRAVMGKVLDFFKTPAAEKGTAKEGLYPLADVLPALNTHIEGDYPDYKLHEPAGHDTDPCKWYVRVGSSTRNLQISYSLPLKKLATDAFLKSAHGPQGSKGLVETRRSAYATYATAMVGIGAIHAKNGNEEALQGFFYIVGSSLLLRMTLAITQSDNMNPRPVIKNWDPQTIKADPRTLIESQHLGVKHQLRNWYTTNEDAIVDASLDMLKEYFEKNGMPDQKSVNGDWNAWLSVFKDNDWVPLIKYWLGIAFTATGATSADTCHTNTYKKALTKTEAGTEVERCITEEMPRSDLKRLLVDTTTFSYKSVDSILCHLRACADKAFPIYEDGDENVYIVLESRRDTDVFNKAFLPSADPGDALTALTSLQSPD